MSNSQNNRLPKPLTRQQLSKILGISHQAITALVKKGLPTHSETAAQEWYEALKTKPTDLNGAKLKKTLLEVERLEIQNAQAKGELISRAEVKEACITVGATLSAEMQNLLGDLPSMLEGLDATSIREKLQPRLNLVLERTKERLANVKPSI
jgi:transcriptional regulator with XRE-family HTH domain